MNNVPVGHNIFNILILKLKDNVIQNCPSEDTFRVDIRMLYLAYSNFMREKNNIH